MFGYIQYSRKEIRCTDLSLFNTFYCGVCKEIKEEFGNPLRLTLSYDIVFLAILLSSIYGDADSYQIQNERCILNPFRIRKMNRNPFVTYSAHMHFLLVYYKCMDDASDERSVRAKAALYFLQKKFKRMQQRYLQKEKHLREGLEEMRRLEKAGGDTLAVMSHSFGLILGNLFVYDADHPQASLCHDLGYQAGRLIFLLDCADDFFKDFEKKRFNPLIHYAQDGIPSELLKEKLLSLLQDALQAITKGVEQIQRHQSKSLVQHLAFYGIRNRAVKILESFGISADSLFSSMDQTMVLSVAEDEKAFQLDEKKKKDTKQNKASNPKNKHTTDGDSDACNKSHDWCCDILWCLDSAKGCDGCDACDCGCDCCGH